MPPRTRVALIGRTRGVLHDTAAQLRDRGSPDAVAVVADIGDYAAVQGASADLGRRWNGELIILFNAGGPSVRGAGIRDLRSPSRPGRLRPLQRIVTSGQPTCLGVQLVGPPTVSHPALPPVIVYRPQALGSASTISLNFTTSRGSLSKPRTEVVADRCAHSSADRAG